MLAVFSGNLNEFHKEGVQEKISLEIANTKRKKIMNFGSRKISDV